MMRGAIRGTVVCGVLTLALAAAAQANTFAPNKLGDHAPNGCTKPDCTLREAITKANHHPGHDTIVLKGGKTYNLSLVGDTDNLNATGDLDVLGPLTLESSGKKLATVDANQIDRVFQTNTKGAVNLTFNRIRVTGGMAPFGTGGGIESEGGGTIRIQRSKIVHNVAYQEPGGGISAGAGRLELVHSTVDDNEAQHGDSAGGIDGNPVSPGEVIAISRSRIVGNDATSSGGGIVTGNRTTIAKSTIAGNHADGGSGGGILSAAPLRVVSSTLSGNVASDFGGGIENRDRATLINDTVTKNTSSLRGGGIGTFGTATNLNAVTVARNQSDFGGGIAQDVGVVNVKNSLIALNTNSGGGAGPDCIEGSGGGIVSGGHNLVGDDTDCTGIFGSSTHDFVNVDPRIAQLANNGGPTKTIALRRHSKAINHAGHNAPKRDQRGVKRGKHPDIGAFERR